jgi:hypothetical protein
MTSMDKRHNQSRLDDNLDRLLGLGEPAPRMPENIKARIRSRLAEAGPGSGKRHFLPGSWALWPLAATAVVAIFLIFFWYGDSPSSIAWADVQQQLNQVHFITLKACTDISATTGNRMSKCYSVYYKDPGLSRTEEYAPDTILVL